MESTEPILVIDSFTGEYAFLSNFYVEKTGKSIEHWYQGSKTLDRDKGMEIINADTPGKAKRMGRKVELRADWEEVKEDLMYSLLMIKFFDPDLAQKLIDTYPAKLIEGNTWNDTYWGVCRGKGQNRLGELLMQVRDELRSHANQESVSI